MEDDLCEGVFGKKGDSDEDFDDLDDDIHNPEVAEAAIDDWKKKIVQEETN